MQAPLRDLVVELSGELDSSVTPGLRREVEDAYCQARARDLIFDLKGVTFLDSSAIGLILGRYRLVHAFGGRVAVAGVDRTTDRIFQAAGLYRLVEKYESAEEAAKAI